MKSKAVAHLTEAWIQAFPAFADALGDAPGRRAQREAALAAFAELGLPHRGLENWRSTSLAGLEKHMPGAPSGESPEESSLLATGRRVLDEASLPGEDALRAVFVDGHFCPALSSLSREDPAVRLIRVGASGDSNSELPAGFGELADAKSDAFVALNAAFNPGVESLEITRDHAPSSPIHLAFISSGSERLCCPRLHITGRRGSRATVILDFLSDGEGSGLVNSVSEIFVEENADLQYVVVEREGERAFHVDNFQAHQERDSRLSVHTLSLGGALLRNELGVKLAGTGAEADLRGLYLASGNQHQDNHTRVDHAMPHTTSREIYKGILAEQARGVFRGLIHVRPDAQKIDSTQSNMNLLLSDRSRIDTQPQLEIHADDVKCSHGSTIGKLDEEALFYLRSRGLDEAGARAMLTRGFVAEICDALPGEAFRDFASALVLEKITACSNETDGAPA